jgi:hypothetical protein
VVGNAATAVPVENVTVFFYFEKQQKNEGKRKHAYCSDSALAQLFHCLSWNYKEQNSPPVPEFGQRCHPGP